jgi:hypothetical protein
MHSAKPEMHPVNLLQSVTLGKGYTAKKSLSKAVQPYLVVITVVVVV